jgi:hypothetical protein
MISKIPRNLGSVIRISTIVNVVTWGTMAGQYLWYFSISGALLIAVLGEFFLICLGLGLSIFSLYFSRQKSRALKITAMLIQLVIFLAFLFLASLFNGPFGVPLLILEIGIATVNFLAFMGHIIGMKTPAPTHNYNPHRCLLQRLRYAPAIILACLVVFGIACFNSFWISITVKAPDDATTTSSYWGNPELNITTASADVLPINNWTLLIAPANLSHPPPTYGNGSLAFVNQVYENGSTAIDYMNYTIGARSYPNGTVVLSDPLPYTTLNATVVFSYVQNWPVLQMLGESNATVILNAFGPYITDPDPFKNIHSTFMFQLLDHWRIKFYLQVDANNDYSHVFNYLNITPLANQTLDWATQWQQFQGVSFDCEQESYPQPEGNQPGYVPLFPGSTIPDSWGSLKQLWYWMNAQNETLFARARAAYESVFLHALGLGKEIEVVLGPSDFSEYIDGDADYHSNPTIPFTSLPNVHYSQMSYHDIDPNGQFAIYRDCVESIQQLGDRGSSILLGWINTRASYYTPDEAGFQLYVNDCLVAQAAGMTEIFHAPLYNIQNIWGDGAIQRLDQALNNASKRSFVIRPIQFTNFFIWDLWKNFNSPSLYIVVLCGFVSGILVEIHSRKSHGKHVPEKTGGM